MQITLIELLQNELNNDKLVFLDKMCRRLLIMFPAFSMNNYSLSASQDEVATSIFTQYPTAVKIKKSKQLSLNRYYRVPANFFNTIPSRGRVRFDLPGYGLIVTERYYFNGVIGENNNLCLQFMSFVWINSRVTDKYNQIIGYPVLRENGDVSVCNAPSGTCLLDPFSVSYTRISPELIIKHKDCIGRGTFGSVKEVVLLQQPLMPQPLMPLCIKTQLNINESLINREYKSLCDLEMTTAPLLKRRSARGLKTIFLIKQFGHPINSPKIKYASENKLSVAAWLLLELDRLHKGESSKTKVCYAHRDIKPDNVLVDDAGKVHFIDFGFATLNPRARNTMKTGTWIYMPINWSGEKLGFIVSNRVADLIAALRTIYHPENAYSNCKYSLLNQSEYIRLPQALQDLLNTDNIQSFLTKLINAKIIASSIAFYQLKGALLEENITYLKENESYQDKLLNFYKNHKQIILNELKKYLEKNIKRINEEWFCASTSDTEKKVKNFQQHLTKTNEYLACPEAPNFDVALLKQNIRKTVHTSRGFFDKPLSGEEFKTIEIKLKAMVP